MLQPKLQQCPLGFFIKSLPHTGQGFCCRTGVTSLGQTAHDEERGKKGEKNWEGEGGDGDGDRARLIYLQNWLLQKSSSKTGAATTTPATAAATNAAAWCSLAAVDLIQATTRPYTLCYEEAASPLLLPLAVCHNLRLPPLLLLLLLAFFTTLVLHFNSILLSLQHYYSISQAHQEGSVSPQKLPPPQEEEEEEDEGRRRSSSLFRNPDTCFCWGLRKERKPSNDCSSVHRKKIKNKKR